MGRQRTHTQTNVHTDGQLSGRHAHDFCIHCPHPSQAGMPTYLQNGVFMSHSLFYLLLLQLTSEPDPSRRDWGTVGACCSLAERGANIVRVHNVRGAAQALAVSDAIRGREARSMSTHACCRRDGDESIMVSSSSS